MPAHEASRAEASRVRGVEACGGAGAKAASQALAPGHQAGADAGEPRRLPEPESGNVNLAMALLEQPFAARLCPALTAPGGWKDAGGAGRGSLRGGPGGASRGRQQSSVPPPRGEPCPSWGRPLGGHKAGPTAAGGALFRPSGKRCPPALSPCRRARGRGSAGAWRRSLPGPRRPVLRRPLCPGPRRCPGLPPPLRAGCWRGSGPSSAPGESPAAAPPVSTWGRTAPASPPAAPRPRPRSAGGRAGGDAVLPRFLTGFSQTARPGCGGFSAAPGAAAWCPARRRRGGPAAGGRLAAGRGHCWERAWGRAKP